MMTSGMKAKGWSVSDGRAKGILPRYCDDGVRCPGHPDWKSLDGHRALDANRCMVDTAWGPISIGWVELAKSVGKFRAAAVCGVAS